MTEDSELAAMVQIAAALEPLDEAARRRALHWAASRFQVHDAGVSSPPNASSTESADQVTYDTFAELYEAASPSTEREKALVACYWVQVFQGQQSFGAQAINAELKDLGHQIGNITEALTALKSERPALVLQLKKGGTSRQARKTYKLSLEGIRRVENMTSIQSAHANDAH
jgi:hypothetical protein